MNRIETWVAVGVIAGVGGGVTSSTGSARPKALENRHVPEEEARLVGVQIVTGPITAPADANNCKSTPPK